MNKPFKKAIDIIGSQSKMANELKCYQSQVWYWLNTSKYGVPAEYCQKVEELTGITREQLRPDVFGSINA